MGELNITFAGFCTSVFDLVPGVPMRTVLPDATAVRFGVVSIPGIADPVFFYLMPHLPIARTRVTGSKNIYLTGCHVRILNARPQPLCRMSHGYSLTSFKKDIRLSSEVVFEGLAMAYFDILGGRVWTDGRDDEPRVTRVSVRTEGKPIVSIAPLAGTTMPVNETLETDELYVTNLDFDAPSEDTHFDFLGNYLVAKGGIPLVLDERTPGMPIEPNRLTMAHLGERLKAFGLLVETEGTVSGWRKSVERGQEPGLGSPVGSDPGWIYGLGGHVAKHAIDPVPLNPSCSPSQYP